MKNVETIIKWVITAIGAVVTFLFGAWSLALNILLVLVILDYGTGVVAGVINGELKSRIGLVGITRKVFIFVMVAVSHMVDLLLIENQIEVGFAVMSTVIMAYCVNEILSIIENVGKTGDYIPEPLTKAIAILQNKPEEEKISTGTPVSKDENQ